MLLLRDPTTLLTSPLSPHQHNQTTQHNRQDVAEALRRLPPHVVVERNQRLKRAMDLSLKHEKLPKALRDKQTPFDHYLLPMLDLVKAEKAERNELGTGAPYQRTIP
jgi:ubiquinol-cytochrome c reductase subunit 7